jgi:hypothetical protein
MILVNAYCQTGSSIKGVVTFFFNKYQGDKPDIGSDVWIVDSAAEKKYNEKLADSFYYANFYRGLKSSYKSMGQAPPQEVLNGIQQFGGNDDDLFKAIDSRNYSQFAAVKLNDDTPHSTVDASGTYSFQVKPGVYYVIIKSHNRTGLTMCEISGKMYYAKVKVKTGQQKDVSTKFDIY